MSTVITLRMASALPLTTDLRLALAHLQRGLSRWQQARDDDALRDACILRFEFGFDLCTRTLKQQLERGAPPGSLAQAMTYRQLIRLGAERGWISDPSAWLLYRDHRNATALAYQAQQAQDIASAIPAFADHAQQLLAQLEAQGQRNA